MNTLPFDIARCSGVVRFNAGTDDWPAHDMCPQRDTCQRYLAFTQWDRAAWLPDYRGISVFMAVENCGHKIEADTQPKL